MQAETVDVTRVLYAFALNASPIAESQVSYPNGVVKSACHLVDEIIQVSAYPKNPGLPTPKSRVPVKPTTTVKPKMNENDENRRPGDWTCPEYASFIFYVLTCLMFDHLHMCQYTLPNRHTHVYNTCNGAQLYVHSFLAKHNIAGGKHQM